MWSSFAAGTTKTWDTQADFSGGILSATTVTSDGHVTLAPSTGSGGVPSAVLPTMDYKAQPYTGESGSAENCYQSVWEYGKSPTTPYISPDSYHHAQRYILVNPNATDSAGHQGKDDWWFVTEYYLDSTTPSTFAGQDDSFFNLHNVAGDSGPNGGIGWGFGDGVSAFHLFYDGSTGNPYMLLENNSSSTHYDLPAQAKNQWHQYVIHIVFGRNDGTTPHAGAVQLWVDGSKKYDLSNLNILQRAKGPDGVTYTQQWVQLWQGTYTKGAPCNPTNTSARSGKVTLARIGNSLSQALNDVPTLDSWAGSLHIAGQPDFGNSTSSVSSVQRMTTDFSLPSDLAGQAGGTTTYPSSGTITLPFDAGVTSNWDSITPAQTTPSGTSISYQYRSSADNSTWSAWASALSSVPAGRYFQLKATLSTLDSSITPSIDSISLGYSAASTGSPTFVSSSITDGQTLSGTVPWNVTTSGSVASVEYWADSAKLATDTTAPYSYNLDTTTMANGSHLINVVLVGTDGSRISAGSGGILGKVTVDNAAAFKPGDLNQDSRVDVTDLSILLSYYGTANAVADINKDGVVNVLDLSALLSNYGM